MGITVEIVGWLFFAAAIAGIVIYIAKWIGPAQIASIQRTHVDILESDRQAAEVHPTDVLSPQTSARTKLQVVQAAQTITLLGDKERQVVGAITLHEMTQRSKGAPWTRKGNQSRVLELAGGIFIFKVPSREGGKPTWIRAEEVESMSLDTFWRGGKEPGKEGPARLFYKRQQSERIAFELPNDLTTGIIWEMVDIGAFDCEVDGESDCFGNSDRFPFVTAREQNGDRWLLHLGKDPRARSKGSGGLFVGKPFEPDVDVKDLL